MANKGAHKTVSRAANFLESFLTKMGCHWRSVKQ